jgi:hypothetical protein
VAGQQPWSTLTSAFQVEKKSVHSLIAYWPMLTAVILTL